MPNPTLRRLPFLLLAGLLLQCSTPTPPPNGGPVNDCPNGVCTELQVSKYIPREQANWSSESPEFTAFFQVVDEKSRPIQGAKVLVGNRVAEADDNGDAPVAKLPALDAVVAKVEHPDYLANAFKASYTTSGIQKLTITMLRKPKPTTIKVNKPVTLTQGDATWQFAGHPFQSLDGTRLNDSVQVTMRAFAADTLPRSAIPGDRVAQGATGETTLLREEISVIMTEITDMAGEKVKFAPGVKAQLSVALPDSMTARLPAGKRLGLYSLDEARAKWVRESTCEVEDTDAGRQCVGTVEHFSYWLVADEFDVYKPETFGCVNMVVDTSDISELLAPLDGRPDPWLAYMAPERCDGEGTCKVDSAFEYGQSGVLRPTEETPHGSLCGVTEAADNYRMRALVVRGGATSFLLKHEFVVDSLQESTNSARLLNQQLDPPRDCPTLCQQIVVKPTMEDLVAGLSDQDRDGFFAIEDPEFVDAESLRRLDCDDEDPATYPGAYESWCEPVDRDCDGRKADEEVEYKPGDDTFPCAVRVDEVTSELPMCYFRWNHQCDLECFARTEEVPGNRYDEDCDGLVLDADGDGYYSLYQSEALAELVGKLDLDIKPGDCHDLRANVYPDALEVPGNRLDEDCDGIALDYDGDGYFALGHELSVHALEAKLEELEKQRPAIDGGISDGGVVMGEVELGPDVKFGDCDDFRASVNPGITVEQEAGQLAHLYSAEGVRRAVFCDYFNADGHPSFLFHHQVRDRNCDGAITDVDGDGLNEPGNTTLGPGTDTDCNDYDARLTNQCGSVFESMLKNESECEPATGEGSADPVAACPLLASSIHTDCTVVTPEVNMCLFPGWDTANPIRLTPGVLWGPCDGLGRVLPDCPAGAACGAPVPYSSELVGYLKAAFTDGAELEFQGMCFRTCEEPTEAE